MNPWFVQFGRGIGVLALATSVLLGCEAVDKGMGTTANQDFTLVLQVPDRFIHVGDQAPITVWLKRTDNSNLEKGMRGRIVITLSANGRIDQTSLDFDIGDDTTKEFMQTIVFTATEAGIAEVRASFLDATALIKIMISGVNP